MDLDARDRLIAEPAGLGLAVGFTKLSKLHNDWIRAMLADGGDMTLQAHRGSYKTTCLVVAIAVLMLLRPNERIGFMRKTDADVKEVVASVRKLLGHPFTAALAARVWGVPVQLVSGNATELTTSLAGDPWGAAQLTAMGLGGSLTGKHFDRIFTDDIVNVQDRVSRAERERTKLIYQELQNLRNPGGRIVNTGTPWHREDAFSIMPEAVRYDWRATGMISEAEAAALRARMTPSLFAANYELRHIAAEDVLFTDPVTGADLSKVEQASICHIDAAYGGGDGTAMTICKKAGGKYFVYGRLWQRHVDECLDDIAAARAGLNAGRVYCEVNGDKGYLAKELRARGERVVTYHESMNKFLKITSYLKGAWQNVVFVLGTDEEYIRQITDYNENAEHDDAPDSLASTVRLLWDKKDEDRRYQPVIFT